MDERRYTQILESSRNRVAGLLWQSIREDRQFLMPRVMLNSFGSILRAPGRMLRPAGPSRDGFTYRVLREWGAKICRICRMSMEVSGLDRIDPAGTYLFASNHRSPVDVAAMFATLPVDASIVANKTFLKVPVFSYWLRASRAVLVEQGDKAAELESFREMIDLLKSGRSLLLFPEGYVNQAEELAEFRRGGISAAVFARVPIVPVFISGSADVIRTGEFRITGGRPVGIRYGEPIPTAGLDLKGRKSIDKTVRERILALGD